MTETHEAIEELLAGYVLRSLSGEDAERADRLLSEHVPACPACRDALAVFQEVSGDLGLEPPPMDPPDTLLPRLHRGLGEQPHRRRPAAVFAVAAGVAAFIGLAGLTVAQSVHARNVQQRNDLMTNFLSFQQQPGASTVPLGPMNEVGAPGIERFYVYGTGIAQPGEGMVYRVWLVSGSDAVAVKDFVPEDGLVVVPLDIDPSKFDRILICVAPAGSEPAEPRAVRWSASI